MAAVAIALLSGLVSLPPPLVSEKSRAAVEHIFDYYLGPPSGSGDSVYATNMLAQSFTASDSYLLTRIDLFIKDEKQDNVVNLTFVQADMGGTPLGTLLTYSSANGPDGYAWVEFRLDRPTQLVQNNIYWIELIDTNDTQSNGYSWARGVIPTDYAGGMAADCPGSNCNSWNLKPETDYLFATYGVIGPSIAGSVQVDSLFAGAGDPLQYTVDFSNMGSSSASSVWINMTLSSNLTYVSDDSASQGGFHSSPNWQFPDVTVGAHSFHINVVVGLNVYDGALLTASYTLQYADSNGVMQENHQFSATTVARVPSLSFSKSVTPKHPTPGSNMIYSLAFTNSGSRLAASVWVNDTLPAEVTYVSDTAAADPTTIPVFAGSWSIGRLHMYNFTNVTPGSYRFEVSVTVNTGIPNGSVILNSATLYHTCSQGRVCGPINATATAWTYGASIRVGAIAWDNPVAPFDTLRYEVEFDNLGTGPAAYVWINDTLPLGVTYLSDTAKEDSSFVENRSTRVGQNLRYVFVNVNNSWPHSFIIESRVDSGVQDREILTNGACLNYTEWDGKLLLPSCASSSATVRIPNVSFIVEDSATADPGDLLDYKMVLTNTGTGVSLHVGIDIFEPPEVNYYFDNSSFKGGLRVGPQSWRFDNVTPGSIPLSFMYRVRSGLENGLCFTTIFELNYTDYRGRLLGSSQNTVRTCITAPIIDFVVLQNPSKASREDMISYTIFYNNTGNGTASDIWINDTIPDGTVFYKSSEIPEGSSGSRLVFHFMDVAPGPHSMMVSVTVEQRANVGELLTNSVWLTYHDANRNPVGAPRMIQTTAEVVEAITGTGFTPTNILWVLVVILLVTLLAMWLFVARKFYGLGMKNKARIDELFLLHRSGELIRHHSRSLRPEVDSDVLSAMLVAVQNFVKESFNFRAGDLEELKFGDEKIMLIHGEHVILAAVIDGPFPDRLVSPMRESLDEIERRYGDSLDEWSGLTDDLPKIDDILSRVFGEKVA